MSDGQKTWAELTAAMAAEGYGYWIERTGSRRLSRGDLRSDPRRMVVVDDAPDNPTEALAAVLATCRKKWPTEPEPHRYDAMSLEDLFDEANRRVAWNPTIGFDVSKTGRYMAMVWFAGRRPRVVFSAPTIIEAMRGAMKEADSADA